MTSLVLDGYLEGVSVNLELGHFLDDLGKGGRVREEGSVGPADGLAAVKVHTG